MIARVGRLLLVGFAIVWYTTSTRIRSMALGRASGIPTSRPLRWPMRRFVAVTLVAVGLSACGPSAGPTGAASPSAAAAAIEIECLGGLDQAVCDKAAKVVVAAVTSSGWTPRHIWINSGSLAPIPELLFDPNANFPIPYVPGGTQFGNAEIAFAETDKHAGLNLAAVGPDIVATLVGYRVPLRGWCSGTCPSASSTDGPFRLELVLSGLDWKADEPISGMAILSFDGPAPTTISGSSGSVINFAYSEVGGTRRVDPVWTADCGPHQLEPATPINADLSKSGATAPGWPNADFVRSFLAGPDVRLPAGTWDITAHAIFTEGEGCAGVRHSMTATVRITVRN